MLFCVCSTFRLETSKCNGVAKAICIKVWNVNKPPTRVLFSIILVQTSSQVDVELARKCVKNKCCSSLVLLEATKQKERAIGQAP